MEDLKKENEELKKEIQLLRDQLNSLADSKKKYYENNKDIVKEKASQRLKKISEENPEKIKEYRRNAYLHLFTFQTPIFTALKNKKNVKSILMVLLFLLLFFC